MNEPDDLPRWSAGLQICNELHLLRHERRKCHLQFSLPFLLGFSPLMDFAVNWKGRRGDEKGIVLPPDVVGRIAIYTPSVGNRFIAVLLFSSLQFGFPLIRYL